MHEILSDDIAMPIIASYVISHGDPEVFDITRADTADNNTLANNLQDELTALMSNLGNIYKDMQKFKKSSDVDLNKADNTTDL